MLGHDYTRRHDFVFECVIKRSEHLSAHLVQELNSDVQIRVDTTVATNKHVIVIREQQRT